MNQVPSLSLRDCKGECAGNLGTLMTPERGMGSQQTDDNLSGPHVQPGLFLLGVAVRTLLKAGATAQWLRATGYFFREPGFDSQHPQSEWFTATSNSSLRDAPFWSLQALHALWYTNIHADKT